MRNFIWTYESAVTGAGNGARTSPNVKQNRANAGEDKEGRFKKKVQTQPDKQPAATKRPITKAADNGQNGHGQGNPPSRESDQAKQTVSIPRIDGSGNNLQDNRAGAANTPFSRLAPQDKTRAPGTPTGDTLPSAREVSNAVVDSEGKSTLDPKGGSDLLWQWGQFIDHDVTLADTPNTRAGEQGESSPISVPKGDPQFDPKGTGNKEIDFTRSSSSVDENGNRQQTNKLTAFVDGSQVYGSDTDTANDLRAHSGGRLSTSEGNLLPTDSEGNFKAGDERVNEQPGLTSMQTLFLREHNRLADQYASENPDWSDDEIYQAARGKNVAQMQAITYNEFLPELLGDDALPEYRGYQPNIDPSISNEFATAAFRFGHSMVSGDIPRIDKNGNSVDGGNIDLADSFDNPEFVKQGGIESILRGQANNPAQALDNEIDDDLRNTLFGPPGSGGLDLAALNIQRGRDHELPSYNDAREALGVRRIESWDDPIFRGGVGEKLASVYDSPDDIDLWAGGLSETNHGDSRMGQLFTEINTRQFAALRDGDRFYYENRYSGAELEQIRETTLSDIIRRNTDVDDIQDNAFRVPDAAYA
ncbi:hypothetical protein AB833_12315 [Chromatiales bacterium (ex Bugula neritina AB1)]|nr:hypothetical protein AB833_12315 [Chromatiales bacterium (ex Bugula neritina AB1)]